MISDRQHLVPRESLVVAATIFVTYPHAALAYSQAINGGTFFDMCWHAAVFQLGNECRP